MYEVVLADSARRTFERASDSLQRRFDRCFEQLRRDPRRHNNIKPLKGQLAGLWRYRVGEYRIVYRIDDAGRVVIVLVIANRRNAYD